MNVIVRADASAQIGSGHVMRCLTLAEALRREGADVQFVCRVLPGDLRDLIERKGFLLHSLTPPSDVRACAVSSAGPEAYEHWLGVPAARDAEETLAALDGANIDWLVVDHYALDDRWETQFRGRARKIMVIDDLADRKHDCDVLLDQNFFLDGAARYDGLVSPACSQLLGPGYALLRPEFAAVRRGLRPRAGPVRRLLVFFGGGDVDNVTARALEALSAPAFSDLHVDVVLGASNPHRAAIERQVGRRSGTTLHVQTADIASLMANADVALGAGGSTTWERLCLGLPSLVVTLAENQVPFTRDLNAAGLVVWLGDSANVDVQQFRDAIADALHHGTAEVASREGMKLVSGDGAQSVAELLTHGVRPDDLQTRVATWPDCRLYWHWANEPEVRANAFNTKPIDWASHAAWFRRKLDDHESVLILVQSKWGPVGQVRFDRTDQAYEIGYSLARQFRGTGLGAPLLARAISSFRPLHAAALLVAQVKDENLASARVFERLGFSEIAAVTPGSRRFHLQLVPEDTTG